VVFGIGSVSAERIDIIGLSPSIKEATLLALTSLHTQGVPQDTFVFLDGSLHAPEKYRQETIIKGDEKVPEIALASIYAKEHRDSVMKEYAKEFPQYFFEKHVGYGTSAHYEAIKKYGLTILHRRSFLKSILENKNSN
jgi:ribonuclease HII